MVRSIEELECELRYASQRLEEQTRENEALRKEVSGVADANVLAAQLMAQLEESAARLQAIVDNALEGVVTFGEDGRIDSFSRRAERIFGHRADRIVGQEFRRLLDPSRNEEDGSGDLMGRLGRKERVSKDTLGLHEDGRSFPIHLSLCKIDTELESVFTAIVRDLTDEKELQSRLMQSEKLESIGRLAAGVAHEINTPIQYVGDNTNFLSEAFSDLACALHPLLELLAAVQEGPCDAKLVQAAKQAVEDADLEYLEEEVPKAIAQSLDGVERVAGIVRAMKTFSHPGTEEKQLANINAAIESTVTVSRNEWKFVADLALDLDPDLPRVPVLVSELNQVMLNMIVNASHAIADRLGSESEAKGQITISSKQIGEDLEIRVADNGSGIPESVRKKVFDPFFTTKDVGRGTGQGLAIARSVVVDKHGGEIDVESTPGEGATFVIRLPVVSSERPADATAVLL